jgi:hypothetical protein
MIGCFAKVAFFIIDFWSQSNLNAQARRLAVSLSIQPLSIQPLSIQPPSIQPPSIQPTFISPEAWMRVPCLAAALQNKPLLARVFSPDLLKISEDLRRPSTKAQLSSGPHHVIQKRTLILAAIPLH